MRDRARCSGKLTKLMPLPLCILTGLKGLCEAPVRFSRTAVFGPTVEVLRLTSLHPDLLVACCLTKF